MRKNSQINNEEINLIELIETVWEGKWKIAVVVVISFIAGIGYQLNQTKNFNITTEIRSINTSAINKYSIFNNTIELTEAKFNFEKITKLGLLNLYIEILNDKTVFEDAMRKFNLLDASLYNNDQEYNEAIIKRASSVKILTPSIVQKKKQKGNLEISYHTINFIYGDEKKWKDILIYVNELANQLVRKKILDDYNNTLSFLKNSQRYKLDELKILMANAQFYFNIEMEKFEMNREFQIEDSQIKIDNVLLDYDRKIADRLAFLREQASIARKLGIVKNTIEFQSFGNNKLVTNITTDTPFYLRGYEAIEKEVELIQSRKNKQAFVDGLLELEIEKRSLEQDRTLLRAEKNKEFLGSLIELEKKKKAIEQDKTLERIELAFQATPLANNNKFSARLANNKEFSATSTNVLSTKFEYKDNKILVLAIVIGLIVGVFYVIISDAFQSHKVRRKKD